MDKFINTSNGGIPLVNNDFRWSDESIRDFIDNHLSDFAVTIGSNGNFYLSGVNISYSAPDYTITEGYVYINGEIVKVDAQTCSSSSLLAGEEFRFEVVETYDTTGAKVTLSGTNINTYKKRRAVPTVVTSTDPLTDSQLVFAVTASQERLQEKIDKLLGSVTYTEQNYVTNGEKITDSIDALDVKLKDVSDIANVKSINIDRDTPDITITVAGGETDIISVTSTVPSSTNGVAIFSFIMGFSNNCELELKFYKNGVYFGNVFNLAKTPTGATKDSECVQIPISITNGDVIKVTGTATTNTITILDNTLTLIS